MKSNEKLTDSTNEEFKNNETNKTKRILKARKIQFKRLLIEKILLDELTIYEASKQLKLSLNKSRKIV